ncbi:MgtC/SapB family protein [Mucilaginibacter auburnensis]|uniref:Putative Mg2+ transporter-C (MgtC) family protein n=1 Tax=Mucilaginibacter auburnensis TaxID=1457233 RepID=A0A2H9VVU5_9SPHI|nr:MgtC/SapB family protein [Mucilaginibacter auburnensis]PJJ84912.1 putative Mg2+ transporter-C (MgtC) family protein [Mucilaginibacter auburnensis]
MDFGIELRDIFSIITSIICGGIIGFERGYKNKSTGFRTILLITLGSTIFTIVSRHGAGADDRISANIITGIGFIGAGVIFKDKMSVLGLTTAAVIWTSAAIGMTAGIGYYSLAIVFTIITWIVLVLVNKIEFLIGNLKKSKVVNITFADHNVDQLLWLEERIHQLKLNSKRLEVYKTDKALCAVLEISGTRTDKNKLMVEMLNRADIHDFH